MRFKGTLALVVICAGLGAYLYFYEIKGGEKREKAKQEENRLWKLESSNIQQIDLISPDQHITAVRTSDKDWKITAPRALEADSEELNRLASSSADMSRESVLEPNAADLRKFGLEPAEVALQFKTKDAKEYKIRFGIATPSGSANYASLEGKREVLLVGSSVASTFKKKLDDLRNKAILKFDQYETQTLDLATEKGSLQLAKENDRWLMRGTEQWAADSSGVNSILGALSSTHLKEFLDGDSSEYVSLGFEKPTADVKLTVGKDRGIKHLIVGLEKSKLLKKGEKKPAEIAKKADEKKTDEKKSDEKKTDDKSAPPQLYIARDESRSELFFVEKDFLDKLLKTPSDLRDKTFASIKRWDIDVIVLKNSKGTFTLTKSASSGDWSLGDAKKKAKSDVANAILDVIEKQVKSFIDKPDALSTYGLDSPAIHVVLKQGADVKADATFGKEGKEGVFAQVKGDSSVKVLDKEVLEKLNQGESDILEPPPPAPAKVEMPPTPAPKKR